MTQPSLFTSKAPRVNEGDVSEIMNRLRGQGWCRAKEFRDYSDRELRAIAEASHGQIIGTNRGYRLLEEASIAEVNDAADRLQSQGERMIARAKRIRQAMHKRSAA